MSGKKGLGKAMKEAQRALGSTTGKLIKEYNGPPRIFLLEVDSALHRVTKVATVTAKTDVEGDTILTPEQPALMDETTPTPVQEKPNYAVLRVPIPEGIRKNDIRHIQFRAVSNNARKRFTYIYFSGDHGIVPSFYPANITTPYHFSLEYSVDQRCYVDGKLPEVLQVNVLERGKGYATFDEPWRGVFEFLE